MSVDSASFFHEQLEAAWRRSDELFALIPEPVMLDRPIGLRHPFLFYLGHLPAFAWNQVGRGALALSPVDEALDSLFARGIDPESEASAREQSKSAWPTMSATLAYRDEVRRAVKRRIDDVLARPSDVLCEHGRVLHLVIEHELMHHETLLYMLAECPSGVITRPSSLPPPEGGEGGAAEPRLIPSGAVVMGAAWDALNFGWDNEFGRLSVDVPAFTIDSLPVRNRDWLSFYKELGSRADLAPRSWIIKNARDISVKTVFGPVPFEVAAGWPAQVSGEQAGLYCEARGGRLPTEAELRRAAYGSPSGEARLYPWGDAPPSPDRGNFGFRRWQPAPVGASPAGASAWGVLELVGNGWEWTRTPFAPLPGFSAWARTYPGYSADFFDDAHDIVFGASWATADVLLRPTFRNWYRRSYPYPFTSFRVVRPA